MLLTAVVCLFVNITVQEVVGIFSSNLANRQSEELIEFEKVNVGLAHLLIAIVATQCEVV